MTPKRITKEGKARWSIGLTADGYWGGRCWQSDCHLLIVGNDTSITQTMIVGDLEKHFNEAHREGN